MDKRLAYGSLALLVILLILALVFDKPTTKPKAESHNTTQPVASSSGSSPALNSLISSLNTDLTSNYSLLKKQQSPAEGNSTIGYKFASYNFEVMLPPTYGLNYIVSGASSETSEYSYLRSVVPGLTSFFSQRGYTTQNATPSDAVLSNVYFYTGSNNACEVNVYNQLALACASLSGLSSAASSAAPLVSLYNAQVASPQTLTIAAPVMSSSQTAGYQLASLDIYGGSGEVKVNYYKTTAGNWQMVNLDWYNDPHEDGDIIPNCGDFESVSAVKAAFKGIACYDSSSRSMSHVN